MSKIKRSNALGLLFVGLGASLLASCSGMPSSNRDPLIDAAFAALDKEEVAADAKCPDGTLLTQNNELEDGTITSVICAFTTSQTVYDSALQTRQLMIDGASEDQIVSLSEVGDEWYVVLQDGNALILDSSKAAGEAKNSFWDWANTPQGE